MNKENFKKAILEQQSEVVSENFVGIDFFSMCPTYVLDLLTEETEKLGGFGFFVKGEW